MVKLFGFEIRRQPPQAESFAPPIDSDGGVNIVTGSFASSYVDLEGSAKTESDLITRYRDISLQPEIDTAIDEITNEAIAVGPDSRVVDINLDGLNVDPKIKQIINDEFEYCLQLLNFNQRAYEIFRQWYIDGRSYYHAMINNTDPQRGIVELRYIDPRNLRKVREVKRDNAINDDPKSVKREQVVEYYLYSEKYAAANKRDFSPQYTLKIAKDSIIHATSGLSDKSNQMVLSYLHKAIKPLNQLRAMEDATVIYRLARAPERRIWYIDVGNLPKIKAEQHMRDMMVMHKNRLTYDASNGEIRDDRRFMTMLDDYWIPRREGNKATEITTLPAGQNLGVMQDVEYFQKRLLNALNIPPSRLVEGVPFSFGKTTEVTRDEVKFFKFIQRLRVRFSMIFVNFLEKQLILKNIMRIEDWEQIRQKIRFDFVSDNYFEELKEGEVIKARMDTAAIIEPFLGKYYSEEYVRKFVLRQKDEDMQRIDYEIELDRQRQFQRMFEQAEMEARAQVVQAQVLQGTMADPMMLAAAGAPAPSSSSGKSG